MVTLGLLITPFSCLEVEEQVSVAAPLLCVMNPSLAEVVHSRRRSF